MTPKVRATITTKIDKLDSINIKTLVHNGYIKKKVKGHPSDWEKRCAQILIAALFLIEKKVGTTQMFISQ